MFVSVVIQNSTREYDKFYDYKVPENIRTFIQPGIRVIVPFGRGERFREAFVMDVKDSTEFTRLKDVYQIIDESPVLTQELIQLSKYMKKRYICTYDLAIRCMLPTGLGLLYRHEAALNPGKYDASGQQDTDILIQILKDHGGKLPVDKLQQIYKKPVLKLLKKLEASHVVQIINHFQIKARTKTVKLACPVMEEEEFQEIVDSNKIRNLKYMRIMEMLYEEGEIPVYELSILGYSMATLKNMQKKGFLAFIEETVDRNPIEEVNVQKTEPLTPTDCQKEAIEKIFTLMESGTCREVMLHGVTGSGKTEVYMQVIARVLEEGKGAVMMVPEIGLTPQTVRLFKGRFGERVAVLHSRLSMGERFDQWNKIKNGDIQVVVGARSAIFAPLSDIGVIIIDEEHETSYKSDRTPKYDARTIAVARCRYHKGLVLYGSATPSVENYWRAKNGKIFLIEMLQRTNNQALPEIIMVNMRGKKETGLRNEFSDILVDELRKNKAANEQSILFINRRGHSNFILCKECGFIAICPYCSISLTWHQTEKRLVCHYCSYTTIMPPNCPACKSDKLDALGLGTQKAEEAVSVIEPGFSVIRMDFDTTGGKLGHQKVLDAFRDRKIDVLVGTQMVAKGHDFPDVTLVGILSADSLLGSGDYRATERTFQLITQAAGRAGRAGKKGRVVLQTYNQDEFSIQSAIRQDYKRFFEQEISLRQELQLPPFCQFGMIQISGKNKELVRSYANIIHRDIINRHELNAGILLSDPAPSPVSKLKNQYRWRILLKHPSVNTLGKVLEWVYDSYGANRKKDWSVSVDINPVSMI